MINYKHDVAFDFIFVGTKPAGSVVTKNYQKEINAPY